MNKLPVAPATPAKWPAAVPLVMGLLYGVSPIDIIPDLIPLLGWSDDVAVILTAGVIAFKMLQRRRLAMKAARVARMSSG